MKPQNQKPATPSKSPPPINTMDLLQARLVDLQAQATVVENVADSEKRSLTEDEVKQLMDIRREFKSVEDEIEVRNATKDMANRLATPGHRQTIPADIEDSAEVGEVVEPARPRVVVGDRVGVTKGSMGFRSFGEFAIAARRTKNGHGDPRIVNAAPATYGQEAVGADGGFAVPPDFRTDIMKQVMAEDSLLARTDQQTTSSNSLTLPIDTSTPWATSGGLQANWVGESGTITGSKPALGQLETKANKLAALVPVTEELLNDVAAMTGYLNSKVADKFTSAINNAIINGSGIGQPLGMLNAACKVTVAAVSGQGSGTVVYKNITAMWSRMYGKLRQNCIWLANQDIEPQLQTMLVPGGTPAFPAYLPPGGLSGSPYSTLMGRPILPLESCQTVGTEGDLILCDPTQYLTVIKAGGMRSDVSMHLYFDADMLAFRFVLRIGGQSYWPAAIARANGSNTLSPIVTLSGSRS